MNASAQIAMPLTRSTRAPAAGGTGRRKERPCRLNGTAKGRYAASEDRRPGIRHAGARATGTGNPDRRASGIEGHLEMLLKRSFPESSIPGV